MQLKTLFLKSKRPLEILFGIFFFLFLVYPRIMVESPLGIIFLVSSILFLFLTRHPIFGMIFILIIYGMITYNSTSRTISNSIQYTPNQDKRDKVLPLSNATTLEEDMISKMAPIDRNHIETTFQPYESHYDASTFL